MASHTVELNDEQEQGWAYLLEQINAQRESSNQFPYKSVDVFMAQTLIDTGNTQFMIRAKAQRQKQVDALMAATALPEGPERDKAIATAIAL